MICGMQHGEHICLLSKNLQTHVCDCGFAWIGEGNVKDVIEVPNKFNPPAFHEAFDEAQ